jgi:hypothetical protein
LRKEILEKAICTSVYGNKDKGMIVIIKPSKNQIIKMIDILDEMAISDVPTYIVNDFSAEELKLLEGKQGNLVFLIIIIK